MKEDEPKRLGRFLKKGSTLTKSVSVSEFSFKEISVTNLTYPDNANANIIHAWLHEKEEIDDFVRRNKKVFEDFQDSNMRPSVLKPRDFTHDWLEERKKARKRNSNHFIDEDEFEMALLEEEESEQAEQVKDKDKEQKNENEEDNKDQEDAVESDHEEDAVESLVSLQKPSPSESVGEAIFAFKMEQKEPSQNNVTEAFQEMKPEQLADKEDSRRDEGYSAGFQEGLLAGKEQAIEEEKEKIDAIEKWTASFKSHLEAMPKEILAKSQKNFLDVAGAICEGILEKKINEDVGNFEKLVQEVLKKSFGDMKVTIKVSPQMYEKLVLKENKYGFIQDESLTKDQFKIESEGGIVRSDIHEVVKTMLENMDLHLFSE